MITGGDDFPLRYASTGRFRFAAPRKFVIVPGADLALFIRSDHPQSPTGDLWRIDLTTGIESLLVRVADIADAAAELPAAEKARRERLREGGAGITAFSVDDRGTVVVFSLAGELWVASLTADADVNSLDVPGPVIDPRVSPDATQVAWHSGNRLWWTPLADPTQAQPLTPDDGATWGVADFIAAEELNRHRGFWWAPDSQQLLVTRIDDSAVPTWWISDPSQPHQPATPHRYPAAGSVNAEVSLWRIGTDRTSRALLRVGPDDDFEYLAAASWPKSGPLVQLLTRDQRTTVVLTFKDDEPTVVGTWSDPHWVDVVPGTPAWSTDGRLLTVRVDPQADRLRLFRDDHPISPADLQIRSLLGVLESAAIVLTAPTPTTCRVAEVTDEGTHVHTPASLAVDDALVSGGWHTGVVGGDYRIDVGARLNDESWRTAVRRARGRSWDDLGEITSHAATPDINPEPDIFAVGDIQVAVLVPRTGRTGQLPVMMMPYGGPHSQRVMAAGPAFVEPQWWADQGFIVVIADGRGTPGVSPSWERAIAGDLMTAAVADQVAALDAALQRYPAADGSRVGITGWSFGGYLSAAAVLREPGRFHAGIAGAPVTEWRWYDTAYTERYLGTPQDNAAAYDASSLLPLAADLSRPLLLIHGLADDNVVAAHTLQLSAALMAAGRPHEVLPLSQVTHMASSAEIAANLLRLQLDFFTRTLHPNAAPNEVH